MTGPQYAPDHACGRRFEVVRLASGDDARLDDFLRLTDVQLRLESEPRDGLFIAESELVIRRAVEHGYRMRAMLLSEKWLPSMAPVAEAADAPVFVLPPEQLTALTGFHVHRGALAAMDRRPVAALADLLARSRRLAVLEDVNNPTNLGAVLRSAVALGVDGVLLSPRCADPLYRRAVRVSMGAAFTVPYARSQDWPGDLHRVREAGFQVLALTPRAGSVPLAEVAVTGRVALLLGAEGDGLTEAAIAASSTAVLIPMHRDIDSLNVAAAAAVAFYAVSEAVRRNAEVGPPGA